MNKEKVTMDLPTYKDNLREMLHEMLKSKYMTDVTLVCDDKIPFKAHKIVLSAHSPVFKNILCDLPHDNTVIYLSGIQHQEMESILGFMYLGMGTFYKERMKEFLDVAKCFELKEISTNVKSVELFDKSETSVELELSKSENVASEEANDNIDKVKLKTHSTMPNESNLDTDLEAILNCEHCESQFAGEGNLSKHIKSKHDATPQSYLKTDIMGKLERKKHSCNECDKSYVSAAHLKDHIQSKHDRFKFDCNYCGNKFVSHRKVRTHIRAVHERVRYVACDECDKEYTRRSLKEHIQSKHEGIKLACNYCGKKFVTNSSMRVHVLAIHAGVRYECDHCEYQATQKHNLKVHIERKHEGVKKHKAHFKSRRDQDQV